MGKDVCTGDHKVCLVFMYTFWWGIDRERSCINKLMILLWYVVFCGQCLVCLYMTRSYTHSNPVRSLMWPEAKSLASSSPLGFQSLKKTPFSHNICTSLYSMCHFNIINWMCNEAWQMMLSRLINSSISINHMFS